MTTIGFIILMSVFIVLIIIAIVKIKLGKSKKYPEYYRDVWITFKFPGTKELITKRAWLAVNDNLEMMWTLSDSNLIIDDDWVTKWKY